MTTFSIKNLIFRSNKNERLLNVKLFLKTGRVLDQIIVKISIQKTILMIFINRMSCCTILSLNLQEFGYARVSTADQHLHMQEDPVRLVLRGILISCKTHLFHSQARSMRASLATVGVF